MKSIIFILSIFILTSCSSAIEQFDQQRLYKLKGQSAKKVIEILGEPDIKVYENQQTKFIYETTYKTYTPVQSRVYLGGDDNQQGFYTSSDCVTTFIIQKNIITDITTTGNCL